ncbi:MAG: hypothetical protein HY753_09060, partial [Nitrospirae bacterium]|nr:hypothetical protein [Nitrospirota bacterium]
MWHEKSVRRKIAFLVISALCVSIILSSETKGGEDSLFKYWQRPVSLQTEKRKNLYPEACGECHKEQYPGWKSSLHSRAVGPGLLGQLKPYKDPEFAESCYFCHAPMMEQSEVRMQGQGAKDKYIKNPYFDDRLKLTGISCAVCHIREGKVYGPPKKQGQGSRVKGQGARGKRQGKIAHDFIEKDFFEKSGFCAACHQLEEGYELNGKLLVNTYMEWKESIYGQNNITCQNCHMPDRQHLWRGIHDKERVKNSVRIETIPFQNGAKLVITNSGVGHLFPTYVTPLIVIKG